MVKNYYLKQTFHKIHIQNNLGQLNLHVISGKMHPYETTTTQLITIIYSLIKYD